MYFKLNEGRHPELNDHSATDLTGVAQTLISIFAEDDDKIRSVILLFFRIHFFFWERYAELELIV